MKPQSFDAQAIYLLFDRAKSNLQFPKIHLETVGRVHVILKVAGQKSKYTGQIQITDDQPFGSNLYFGRIAQNGVFFPGGDCTEDILNLLFEFSNDPVGVAAAYGKLHGNCCFCTLPLTDVRSTQVGYGATCAENYGLPWGVKVGQD